MSILRIVLNTAIAVLATAIAIGVFSHLFPVRIKVVGAEPHLGALVNESKETRKALEESNKAILDAIKGQGEKVSKSIDDAAGAVSEAIKTDRRAHARASIEVRPRAVEPESKETGEAKAATPPQPPPASAKPAEPPRTVSESYDVMSYLDYSPSDRGNYKMYELAPNWISPKFSKKDIEEGKVRFRRMLGIRARIYYGTLKPAVDMDLPPVNEVGEFVSYLGQVETLSLNILPPGTKYVRLYGSEGLTVWYKRK